MIWLTWRQFRTQAAVALGALAVVAVALAVTGPHVVHLYDTTVAACKARNDCPAAKSAFLRYDLLLQGGLNALVIFVPGLIGMFWGAPPGNWKPEPSASPGPRASPGGPGLR
jgi:hypothetical protein